MDTSVLVVGGGPVGLALAGQLGRFGVDVVLVERRTGPDPHPRARSINVRTNEIFRAWGLEDEVRSVCLPQEWTSQMVFTTTLAGREIGRVPMDTQGTRDGIEYSPCAWQLTSQDRLEPVLRHHAARFPSVQQWWGWQLDDFTQDAEGVTATVSAADGSGSRRVRAAWMVAADGAGSRVRKALGVAMEGGYALGYLVNTQFHADLGPWTDHRPAVLYWTTDPARNVFQKIDTDGRWLCQITYSPKEYQGADFDPARAAEWIRTSVGAPDLEVDVVDTIPWTLSSTVAERFRAGRVLLAGDAAHQLPPSGGFGMNSGIQDAHNLGWKLAGVVGGWAGEGVVDSYDTERRPLARWNADRSLENGQAVGRIRKMAEGRRADELGDGGLSLVRRYTGFLGMDLGLRYDEGVLLPDGSALPPVGDPVVDYLPVARPGHRAPHHWLAEPGSGRRISTLDLFDTSFVLLSGPEGRARADALGSAAARAGVPLRCVGIGRDLEDVSGGWADAYGVEADGAVLVRPDGMVAARWPRGEDAPAASNQFGRLLR